MKRGLLSRTLHVHPVFILGVAMLLVSVGALSGQVLFVPMLAGTGVGVAVAAVMWLGISLLLCVLGLWRSSEVIGDAQ